MMSEIVLAFLSLVTLGAAVGVIGSREAVHSALYLTVHLLGIAGLFLFLNHQFLAVAQVLVYAGAVMVVFLFAVTTLNPEGESLNLLAQSGLPLLGLGVGLLTVGGLFWSFSLSNVETGPVSLPDELPPASNFAYDLFGPYLLPFEGTAFVLLTALIGAVILGGRRQMGDG